MTKSENAPRMKKPKRFSELSPQEQINLACSGDPDDDDGTQRLLDDEDSENEDD